ncbi:MAG: extracellular solute-binding protein [Pirellulales bacterium]
MADPRLPSVDRMLPPRENRRQWLARSLPAAALPAGSLLALSGCLRSADDEVVVYAALDREFSGPLLDRFQTETSVSVAPKYDVESTKTVGLVNALMLEKDRPRCDVFWNNEILHTLRLARAGALEPYRSPEASHYPAAFRQADGLWYGFAARARVLLVNREQVANGERPASIAALADPRWSGKAGLAKPLFGTTATHAAVLFAIWGEARATAFFETVHRQARIMSGNKQVATAVGRGQLAWGLTDTDDAIDEVESGAPVDIVFPDQSPDGMGTLLIPNTVAIIRRCPHPQRARQLIDFLLRPAVERQLAAGASAQFPLHDAVTERPRVEPQPAPRWMEVDFEQAANRWDAAARFLKELFTS